MIHDFQYLSRISYKTNKLHWMLAWSRVKFLQFQVGSDVMVNFTGCLIKTLHKPKPAKHMIHAQKRRTSTIHYKPRESPFDQTITNLSGKYEWAIKLLLWTWPLKKVTQMVMENMTNHLDVSSAFYSLLLTKINQSTYARFSILTYFKIEGIVMFSITICVMSLSG